MRHRVAFALGFTALLLGLVFALGGPLLAVAPR